LHTYQAAPHFAALPFFVLGALAGITDAVAMIDVADMAAPRGFLRA
jgi:hypothetical protein